MVKYHLDKTRYSEFLTELVQKNTYIDPEVFKENNLKRGLRNLDGTGVLVGATHISSVVGYDLVEGKKIPKEGELLYRGIPLTDIVQGCFDEQKFGFEEVIYLLIFGKLPTTNEMNAFLRVLMDKMTLPQGFLEDVILNTPSKNVMNKLQRVILTLYSYDDSAEDMTLHNQLSQSLDIIAKLPAIMSYCYMAKRHYYNDESLILHTPQKGLSIAENILYLTRQDCNYTEAEAQLLDLCLVIHAEHGGGNNSTFATHVVSSSGTDTYSAISTAMGSLKGPKHGGANAMVAAMLNDLKLNVPNWTDANAVRSYLINILDKRAFNRKGLIYGMGHAVYTQSDPRAILLKQKASEMAIQKDKENEFQLLVDIEIIAKELIFERNNKVVCANVDLYAGFVYEMLGLSEDIFTPLFAVARSAGWCAHRLEQIQDEKIIRPAYINLVRPKNYVPTNERQDG